MYVALGSNLGDRAAHLHAARLALGSLPDTTLIAASSIEETALAVEILCADPASHSAALRGLTWLMDRVEDGRWREPTPIGFYFAKLWYFERLYPLIFTAAALRAARSLVPSLPGKSQPSPDSPD